MEKQPLPDGRGSDRSPDREGGVVPGPLPLFNCRRISLFLELFLRFFPDAACLRGLAVAVSRPLQFVVNSGQRRMRLGEVWIIPDQWLQLLERLVGEALRQVNRRPLIERAGIVG